jgi:hypothetical protein
MRYGPGTAVMWFHNGLKCNVHARVTKVRSNYQPEFDKYNVECTVDMIDPPTLQHPYEPSRSFKSIEINQICITESDKYK